VKVQGHKEEGQIYPPLLVLKYGEVTQEDTEANVEVPFTFSVEYEMENSMLHAIEVGCTLPSQGNHIEDNALQVFFLFYASSGWPVSLF
jgi:hypothetical protein